MRNGLPEEYYARLRHYRWSALYYGLVLTVLGGATTWGAFFGPVLLVVPVVFSALLVLHIIILLGNLNVLGVGNRCCARVIPFFPSGVSGPCTFLSGAALARNWSLLNAVALENGREPLSSFGLGGEPADEEPDWYDPAVALTTISTLLGNLNRYTLEIEDPDLLRSELELLRDKLQEARKGGVLFCLHLKTEEAVSPQLEALRKGTYF